MAERRQYYTKFTEEWQRDVPFIPLYYVEGCKAVRANIENYDILLQTSNAFDWKVEGKTPEDLVTVRIAIPFMENYINPLWGMASLFSTWMTLVPAFPQLLKEQHQPDGTYANVPDLAESYEVSKDGLTLTFHLHKNIAWTDGVPFTSEDVKVTFDGILDPNTGVAAMADLKDIRQVETPDKYTVVFRMSKLNPLILTAMNGFCTGAIVPAHVFSKIPHAEWRGYWTKVDQVVSLGAYKILELVPNERVVLEANPKYWRGKPFVSRIEIVVIPEISTAISALKKGEIDALGIEYPTSGPEFLAALPELEKDPSLDLTFSPISSTAYWGMNLNHPILGNRYVRLALANLIPIDNIIKDLLKGHGKPANGPIDATSPFYDSKFPPICQYNPEKAKEYLAKAGYTPRAVGLPSIAYAYTIAAFVVGLVVGVGAGFARKKRAA
jgi:ABC-type transport system substrate-binding protein